MTAPAVNRKPRVYVHRHDEHDAPCFLVLNVGSSRWGPLGNPNAYALIPLAGGGQIPAHRWTWMVEHGREIPAGMVIHHRCFRKRCVNPEHLELCWESRNLQYSNWGERKVAA